MLPEFKRLLNTSHSRKKENQKMIKTLLKQRKINLDNFFSDQTDAFFENNSCLDCANCCKTTSPIFRDVDIERIASSLQIKPGVFVQHYLHLDQDGHYVLNMAPCPFLEESNKCSIYKVRPQACREYPHTNRKNMFQILDLTFKNSLICPAVASIFEKLNHELK
jgi:Fe-S-cluster containining protein